MSNVDDFLEHYGVPGMKWGHRKSAPISMNTSSSRNTPSNKGLSRNQKVAIGVGAAAVIGVGAAFIARNNNRSLSSIKSAQEALRKSDATYAKNMSHIKDVFDNVPSSKVNNLLRTDSEMAAWAQWDKEIRAAYKTLDSAQVTKKILSKPINI